LNRQIQQVSFGFRPGFPFTCSPRVPGSWRPCTWYGAARRPPSNSVTVRTTFYSRPPRRAWRACTWPTCANRGRNDSWNSSGINNRGWRSTTSEFRFRVKTRSWVHLRVPPWSYCNRMALIAIVFQLS